MKVRPLIEGYASSSESDVQITKLKSEHVAELTIRAWMHEPTGIQPERFLPLARAIASAVDKLHQQQMIHLDLRPERITVLSNGTEVDLKPSSYVVYRSKEGYILSDYGIYEAGLPYCSPEHTGRMGRTVDERSDLYSLGVIFYEMLSGQLPFKADNPLEWVYMHLAQSPPPLTNLATLMPEGIVPIVMRLLEKNPDKRYQNVKGLIADLDKIERLSDTLFIETCFHGRDHECSVLNQAFYAACFGSTEMVYVSGDAGIGKTSLIEEVFRKQEHTSSFFYITGKFEQFSNESPYHPIVQAFSGLMRHLLGERQDQSQQWKLKLQAALGSNANLITEMIPEVGLILGRTPATEELPAHESKKRFLHVFRKFVQALATKEHPLVLFIDDLQWAHSSSLQLIHALLCDPECQYIMFICAYRQQEWNKNELPGYELNGNVTGQAVIRHLQLSPLSLEQMNEIVVEMLHLPAATTLSLTELLYPKSKGNPFHFKQILLHLQDDRMLYYHHEKQCWQWNLGQIIEQEPSYSIHNLMQHKLHRLSSGTQALLQIAACVGSTFHPHLIAQIAEREKEDLLQEWHDIETEGIITPYETDMYRFTHDHIQHVIYSQIDNQMKQTIHLRIGRCLNKHETLYGESPFDRVNHLNQGSHQMTETSEILQLAYLNLDAGNRAKTATAYDIALAYYGKGVDLLVLVGDWEQKFELCFDLHIQKAECDYLCGNYTESERELDALLDRARNPVERSRVQMIRITQYINQGKYLEGTALGLDCLREHHILISPNPSSFMLYIEGVRIELLLRDRYDKLLQLTEMSDQDRISAMKLIFAITPSTFFTNKKVFFLLMCRAIQLSLKYGNTPVSAAVYSSFGMLLGQALGKYDKGYAIGKVGVELAEHYNISSLKSQTYTMFGGVLCQFAGNALEGERFLVNALRFGMDSGDYVFASYAMGAHVNSLYTRSSLSGLSKTIADYMGVLETTKDEFVRQNFYLYQQYILALQGKTAAPDSFSSVGFREEQFISRIHKEETSATTLYQYSTYKTQLYYFLNRYEEAVRSAQQAKVYETYATHLPHLPECLLYESLAVMSLNIPSWTRSPMKKLVYQNLRRFKQWAAWSSTNYKAKYTLLTAELARVSGQFSLAEERYDKAIREAREHHDIQVQSLAGEAAARYYFTCNKRKTALYYLELSLAAYQQWEISIKVDQMETLLLHWKSEEHNDSTAASLEMTQQRRAHDQETPVSTPLRDEPHFVNSFDLAAILKTSQAITNQMDVDTVLAEIMNTIMKYAGASKGALLTSSKDTVHIQVYADSMLQTVTSPLEVNDSHLVPEGLIRYVLRTKENVYYTAEEESWLIHNPYIEKHRPQSALCIPVTVHGTMLGVLYLENKLTNGVFPYDRTPVLLTMASHGLFLCVLQSLPNPANTDHHSEELPESSPSTMEEPLTDRELEVLALLAAGLSNKEIADRLIIAVSTVKVHVKNIFAKLKVNRRINAIAQAKELKLLTPDTR